VIDDDEDDEGEERMSRLVISELDILMSTVLVRRWCEWFRNGIYRLFWYCISVMFSLNEDRSSQAFRCVGVRFVFGRSCGMEHQKETCTYSGVTQPQSQKNRLIPHTPDNYANFRCLTILVSGLADEAFELGSRRPEDCTTSLSHTP
jgi:hypothetical protein